MELKQHECIGAADNARAGRKAHTGLAVYYVPDPKSGKAFVAEVTSYYEGKGTVVGSIHVGSLDLCLAFFKTSALKEDICIQCDDWWERNEDKHIRLMSQAPVGIEATNLGQVIGWLYQGERGDAVTSFAEDFCVPIDDVRDAVLQPFLKEPKPSKPWVDAFVRAAKWFDREAWQAAKQG